MSTNDIPPFYVEGLAAVGDVVKVELEECGVPGRQRIIAILKNGKVLKSMCIDARGAKRLLAMIREYMQLSKHLVLENG
ncbi:MAG TPA: hypothetical protein EYH08_03635 [Pyrodictium sp.]|nr:hypothetical protein [Pyrodictium sp.]